MSEYEQKHEVDFFFGPFHIEGTVWKYTADNTVKDIVYTANILDHSGDAVDMYEYINQKTHESIEKAMIEQTEGE